MKKIVKYIGNILVLISIIFIISTILKMDINLRDIIDTEIIVIIIILSIISIAGIILDAIAGKILIHSILKVKVLYMNIYEIYSKSNIGKYIPGNIMHYVSRSIYCKEYNIKSSDMFYITIQEIICKVSTAFMIMVVLAYEQINKVFEILDISIRMNKISVLLIGIVLLLAIAATIYYKVRNIKESYYILIKLIRVLILYGIIFIINAIIFMIIVYKVSNVSTSISTGIYVIGIYTMAWLIGYVTPGAPGGVGIKETIIIVLLSPIYNENIIVIVAIVTRIISVLGDILAYLIGIVGSKLKTTYRGGA